MRLLSQNLLFLVLFSALLPGSTYYAATDGSAMGDGSAGDPWDRATAISHPSLVCGDIVEFYAGDYDGSEQWNPPPCETPGQAITFRNVCGASVRHIISSTSDDDPVVAFMHNTDRIVLTQNPCERPWSGRHRIAVTDPDRDEGLGWVGCYPNCRPPCIEDFGDYNKVIGMFLLDCGDGIRSHNNACGSEYSWNVIAFSGWDYTVDDEPDFPNAAGNGLYMNNADPTGCSEDKVAHGNIVMDGFETGFQWYGSSGTFIKNGDFRYNVFLNNGHTAEDDAGGGLLTGKTTSGDIENNDIIDNVLLELIVGYTRCNGFRFYQNPMSDSTVTGNYIRADACTALQSPLDLTNVTTSGNVIVGTSVDTFTEFPSPANTLLPGGETTDRLFEYVDNENNNRRIVVAIDGNASGGVSYTPASCSGTIRLTDVQDFENGPHATIDCAGGTITLAEPAQLKQPIGTIASGGGYSHLPVSTVGSDVQIFLAEVVEAEFIRGVVGGRSVVQ